MKRLYYYALIMPLTLFISGTAQTPCITCPPTDTTALQAIREGVKEAVTPFRDSVFKKLSEVTQRQENIIREVESMGQNNITVRSEIVPLFPFQNWRYDWYYRNGNYFKLKITKL